MSYRDFDRGLTADEINARKKAGVVEKNAAQELHGWNESERRLNVLRSIKEWNKQLDAEILKRWREAQR